MLIIVTEFINAKIYIFLKLLLHSSLNNYILSEKHLKILVQFFYSTLLLLIAQLTFNKPVSFNYYFFC